MKKILFIFHKISYGGANKMLAFVANTLAKKALKCLYILMKEMRNQITNLMKI